MTTHKSRLRIHPFDRNYLDGAYDITLNGKHFGVLDCEKQPKGCDNNTLGNLVDIIMEVAFSPNQRRDASVSVRRIGPVGTPDPSLVDKS